MRSFDQVARVLTLIPYLQAHPNSPLEEIADRLRITPAQVLKDLAVIWMCGLPGGLPGDLIEVDMEAATQSGVVNLSNAEVLARPMRFTPDEVFSLSVALQVLAELATGPQREVVATALAKLHQLAGVGRGVPVTVSVHPGADGVREQLTQALETGRRVRLTYDGSTRGRTTRPEVDPAALVLRDGVAYLRGYSLDRGDWRTYRLDRIADVAVLERGAEDHGALPAMPTGWFDDVAGATEVVLDLAPQASWLVEYDPTEQVEELPDGGVRARFRVVDPQWVTRRLLRLGAGVRSVDPPEAAALSVELAREALALQDSVGGV